MNDTHELTELPDRYYRPSGAVPVMGTLTMLFGGMAASVILGFFAALINRYFPYVIALLAVTLGYGAGVGAAVRFSAKIAHVRHPGFTRFVAFVVGLFAVYTAWVWYLWVHTQPGLNVLQQVGIVLGWFTQPGAIVNVMQFIAGQGAWSVFGWTPKGGVLYAIWTFEALMYISFAVAIAVNPALTYCEACRCWTKRNEKLAHMPLTDFAALKTDLEAERYEVLDELRSQPCDMNNRLDIGAATCPYCTTTSFLTVSHVTVGNDGNGNPTENSEPVVQHLIVPREIADRMAVPVTPQPAAATTESGEDASEAEPAPA